MTNASTQLRALEGEIAEINAQRLSVSTSRKNTKRKAALADILITIAKELEKERDAWKVDFIDNATSEIALDYVTEEAKRWRACGLESNELLTSLRTENATLKRRLDEAMKELEVSRNTIAALQIRRQYGSSLDNLI